MKLGIKLWVARDEDNSLYVRFHKPVRTGFDRDLNYWIDNFDTGDEICLNPSKFPELSWEDEPKELEV